MIFLRLTTISVESCIASLCIRTYTHINDIHSHFNDLDNAGDLPTMSYMCHDVHFSQEKLIICYVFIASSKIICLDVAINIDTHIN